MIAILLATYNGSKYLDEFLDSMRRQSHVDWTLYARDDGSTDDTTTILRTAARLDTRIRVVDDRFGNQGVVQNFAKLIERALADGCTHAFFADQDDVWLEHKVERELDQMRQLEQSHAEQTPILVHSDLTVTDSNLQPIHPSFIEYSGIYNNLDHPLRTLLVQNFVTGCTIVANRALLEASLPIPDAAVMHDWWLALCAASLGTIGFVAEPTINYRQHDDNQVGATGFSYWQAILKRLRGQVSTEERQKLFEQTLRQAQALLARVERQAASTEGTDFVGQFCGAFDPEMLRIRRVNELRKLHVPELPLIRKLLWYRRSFLARGLKTPLRKAA